MKTKYSVLILTSYALILMIGLIYDNEILLKQSTLLAIISSGFMQYSESKKTQDEREKFINERAQSKAFIILMAVILVCYFINDIYGFISGYKPALIFEVLFGVGFMSYTSMYIYLSRKY